MYLVSKILTTNWQSISCSNHLFCLIDVLKYWNYFDKVWQRVCCCFGRYNCNRYDEDEAKAARDAQEKSRAALQRYLFYCNRYMNHMQSLRLEHKLYSTVKEKMEEMQQHNMSWIEVTIYWNFNIGNDLFIER